MRIAYFTESLPPNTDGVVNTLVHLADTLQQENVDFLFYSPVKPENGINWSDRVTKLPSLPLWLYKDYKFAIPYFNGIGFELEKYQPDLIHVITPSLLGLYGLQYGRRNNIPVVTSYHTHFVSYFSYFGISALSNTGWQYLQWFHNRCERTYAPSPSAIRELEEKGIQGLELWQRGIELDRFSPDFRSDELRRSIGVEDKPILLFVGRLINHKDLDDLADASDILKSRGHDFKLVIVGDGPMRLELQDRLPDAHFPGYQYGLELSKWYASADVFTFPSTTETFGNVILESFASGVPAIGAAKGGVADIINHNHDGMIAKPNDPKDFADQVERLLVNPDLRYDMRTNAMETAKRYSWDAINRRLINSYRQVTNEYAKIKKYANALAS